jgi:tRNA nucleotidyltransferase (CCA-adding enzyme)
MAPPAANLRERLLALPGMDALLPALDESGEHFYLVGGAVRDLLRGDSTVDLDVAVEGDAVREAGALAERLGGTALPHERFGTATVRAQRLVLDLASTRRETYPQPGALPVVEPAPLLEDLRRRDFTVNAMALGLSGDDVGRLHDPADGRVDLDAGLIRILHPRSFLDDPTRLLRAVRYESRLNFALEDDTDQRAREAVAAGALVTVSGARIRAELMDLLCEHDAPRSVERLAQLGIDRALHPAMVADAELVANAKLGAMETGANPALAALAALCAPAESAAGIEAWVGSLGLTGAERDAVLRASTRAPSLARELRGQLRASELRELLEGEPAEVLALALALGAPADPVLRYLGDLRSAGLEISGDDLIAEGIPQSPAVGRALKETLGRKLDGEISGREEELRVALAIAREAE